MSATSKPFRFGTIRLYAVYSLIFFVYGLVIACQSRENNRPPADTITIRWTGKGATGLVIPQRLTQSVPTDSMAQVLSVRLAGKATAILGTYRPTADGIMFEPLVPFTRGLRYSVWLRNRQLGELTIPGLAAGDRPTLLGIYPSSDSLPDNLLKLYLHFSRPMREGQSLRYVTLLKNGTDTLPGVFLDLQPELWNANRTLLTLWLDPGRIKRDLQPNKLLGTPLQAQGHYTLVVDAAWPDAQGAVLGRPLSKTFFTTGRDSSSPAPTRWALHEPKAGSRQRLTVRFGEALDYSLLTETLHVINEAGKAVGGRWQPADSEKQGWFVPNALWESGRYILRVEGRLEDLAGNNLNRPFDRDITRKGQSSTDWLLVTLPFVVR